MSVLLSQITNTQVFGTWLNRTNQTLAIITANTVTTDNTSIGGFTSGNATVNGIFGANTIFARDSIRGGNVTTSNTLTIVSNTTFQNINGANLVYITGNTTTSNLMVGVGTVSIVSNLNSSIVSNNLTVNTGFVTTFNTGNLTINGTLSTINTNTTINASNTIINANTFLNNKLSVINTASFSNTIAVTGAATLSNTITVTGAANLQSSLGVGGSANVAGNLRIGGDLIVTGNMAFSAQIAGDLLPTLNAVYRLGNTSYRWESYFSSVNVSGANSNFQSGLLYIDTTNNRIGINNTTPTSALTVNGVVETNSSFKFPDGSIITAVSNTTTGAILQAVDSFSTSTYRSANYTISIKNNNANGYQVSNILIIHDGTNSYLTEFGAMYTNTNLGSFTTDINAGNVRLLFTPVSTSTTLKIKKTTLVV